MEIELNFLFANQLLLQLEIFVLILKSYKIHDILTYVRMYIHRYVQQHTHYTKLVLVIKQHLNIISYRIVTACCMLWIQQWLVANNVCSQKWRNKHSINSNWYEYNPFKLHNAQWNQSLQFSIEICLVTDLNDSTLRLV